MIFHLRKINKIIMDHKENKEHKKENNKSIIKIKDNNKEGNTQKNQNSIKSNKLQEKLKKIFLEREKAKYKYNKQLIPEQLKYNSDDEESNLGDKKDNNNKNIQIKTNDNIFNNKNSKINLNNNNDNDKNEDKKNKEDKIMIMENKEMVSDGNKENTQKNEMLKLKENNNESNKIKDKNKKRFRNNNNNENSDEYEYKQKYYQLLNSKTVENTEKNDDKELLSRSLGDIGINNKEPIKDRHIIISNREREKEKEPLKGIDSFEKKNVLKILELIKSKKNEREIIVQKKEEIKRSRSLAIFRGKEKDNTNNSKNTNITNINTFNNKNKNKEIKRILTGKKIYKKNPKSHKINLGHKNKKSNYLTEVSSKNKENKNKNLISLPPLSPLNISEQSMNLLSAKNQIKSNRFVINNRLQNKQNKNENLNNDKSQLYQTSNRIKVTKKYEKPLISSNNNNNFNSTIYYNKSLSKNKKILENLESENENIPKSGKYHESIIYSPKKNKIKKIKSENNFTKKNKLDNDYINNNNKDDNNSNNYSNYYVKKKTLLNESKNLSKSNYNIYSEFPNIPNFPNIHNYYNNSKIFLKNKYISINPSFSINNNFNNNKIEQIEINNNNDYLYKLNKNKEYEKNKKNSKKIVSGSLNYSNNGNTGGYIYYKNKINVKNKNNIIDRSLQEKEIKANESINTNTETNTGKIDDINYINYDYDYEYLPLGTEEMTYSNNNNKLKNAFLNLKVYPENNTFHQNQSSPYDQRGLKIRASNTLNNINYKRNYRLHISEKKNSILMNIDNILIFEEKFSNIVSILKNKFSVIKPCLDFWNYYYNSLVYEKLEKIFNEEGDITIINMSIKYLLLTVMICYSFSNKGEIYNSNSNFLLLELMQLLELNYNSIMLIFLKINNLFLPENNSNSFLSIISSIYINYIKTSNYIDNSNLLLIEKIYNNIEKIDSKIKSILSMKKFDFYKILYNFYFNIRQKDFKEINSFFIQCILTEESTDGSLFSSTHFILNNTSTLIPINPPYLRSPNKKKLTLILDLNDTLINFKSDQNGEGYVRIRPFLFGFLEEISQLYELIIFTNSEKEYADSVIEAIEHERTYFDHVLYRQHAIIVGVEFVKDLTRIGRPLNATIIIDNMPQNFKLQKENGILIKPFWGEDSSDRTLYDLMPILLDVAKDGGDVRHGLKKYRNEIIGKISSNILKKKFEDSF